MPVPQFVCRHSRPSQSCRSQRGVGFAAFIVMIVMIVSSFGGVADAQDARPASSGASVGIPALSALATCVGDAKKVAVVLLIDESGSLKQTDPLNRRVIAAKSALDSLAGLADREIGGSRPTVNVSIATFSSDYRPLVPWTSLSYSNLPTLNGNVESLASRNRGIDTDYAAALLGAQQALAEQRSVPCRAVMWFTDGKYDIDARRGGQVPVKSYAPGAQTTDELISAGQQLICQPKGLADQLRGQHIANIVLALTGGLDSADKAFLSALTIGSNGDTKCGDIDGRSTGAYLPVNNLSELVASFDSVGALLGFGVQGKPYFDIPVCTQTICNAGTRTVPVDLGMGAVHLSAQTGGSTVSVVLHSPQGAATLTPHDGNDARTTPTSKLGSAGTQGPARIQQFSIGSAAGRAVWLAPDVVTIDVKLPADSVAWSGQWTVTFVNSSPPKRASKSAANIAVAPGFRTFYYSSVSARLRPSTRANVSETTKTKTPAKTTNTGSEVELIDRPGGSPLLPAVIAATKVSIVGAADQSPTAPFTTPFTSVEGASFVPSTSSGPVAQVEIRMKTASGIVLLPTRVKLDRPAIAPLLAAVPKRPILTARRVLTVAAGLLMSLLLAGIVLVMRHRRQTFPSMRGVQVVARPVRIAFDSVGRHRIVWLGPDGAESQFRLSTVTFESGLPTKRSKGFEVGGVQFSKNARTGVGIATKVGALMMTGPETEARPLDCNPDSVKVSPELAPTWLLAGEFADLVEPKASSGATGASVAIGTLRAIRNNNVDRAFDGVMILVVNSVDQIPMLERSVLQDLPGVARQQLRSVSSAA